MNKMKKKKIKIFPVFIKTSIISHFGVDSWDVNHVKANIFLILFDPVCL